MVVTEPTYSRVIAYDVELMRPGCSIVQAALGADSSVADHFDTKYWLTHPTDGMKCYTVTPEQLRILVKKTEETAL